MRKVDCMHRHSVLHVMPWHAKLRKLAVLWMSRHAGLDDAACNKTVDNFDLFALWGPKHDFKSGIWGICPLKSCRGLKKIQFHIRIDPKIRSFTLSKACSKLLIRIWVVLGDWFCISRKNCDFDIVKGRIRVCLYQTKVKITSKAL